MRGVEQLDELVRGKVLGPGRGMELGLEHGMGLVGRLGWQRRLRRGQQRLRP